jgi:hypothetical protein
MPKQLELFPDYVDQVEQKREQKKALALVLRNLERRGLIESRLCPDGQARWFITELGKTTPPEDVPLPSLEERLS